MRIDLGQKSWVVPMPVLIIGSYDENGIPDAMNAAWGGICDYNTILISVASSHKTTNNILKSKAFTVSFADVNHMVEADYLGLVSGNENSDKIAQANLTPVKSTKINAPLFDEFPLSLECELLTYDTKTDFLIGKIINVSADENIMNGEDIDINKLNPIIFNSIHNTYMTLGETVGKAFSDGNKIR